MSFFRPFLFLPAAEAVLHIRLEQSLVGFIDLLDREDSDVGGDVVRAAEVEHRLRLGDAVDGRAGEASPMKKSVPVEIRAVTWSISPRWLVKRMEDF
jgi:hypothetical protein